MSKPLALVTGILCVACSESGGGSPSPLGPGANSSAGGTAQMGGTNAPGGTSSAGGLSATGGNPATAGSGAGSGGTTVLSTGGPRWVGRVDASNPNAVRFAWQGAGLVATVNGTSIAVQLRTEGTSTVYFQPVIDNKMATRFKVDTGADQTVTLASGLAAADHVVELYRDTEGMYGLSTFLGFTSGTVKGAPAASGRLIEVVGDSISAGYGNLGSEPHPNWVATPACHWTADNSTWYLSYAAVAGHALNAEVSTIARAGWGMYRDLGSSTTGVLSSVYANALGTDNNAVWGFVPKASVVVINLGTNDWGAGDPGTPYETAYKSFMTTIRSHYPDAWIFLTIGSMLSDPALSQVKTRLANVVAAFTAKGDQKLATFDLGTQNMGADGSVPTGCDWHPNVADHQRMAGILQQQLSSKLGWQVP
ncbi:MAG TPA: SGNH/GDSL hydrolase family protein [Polyangia bacterium]|nr:SGNH/GDSL hydrolase family protein [Polyangia bacterium]